MRAVDVPKLLQRAVDEALELYSDGHVLHPTDVSEARADFVRFYTIALRLGLHGIRWNFGGCIVCDAPHSGVLLQRILLADPRIVAATEGRAFGTVVCQNHANFTDPLHISYEVVDAALQRLLDHPGTEEV